jgi:hypothetical protein
MRTARRLLVAAGALLMGYAVLGALTDPDVRPIPHLLFLAGVLVAHDVVVLPLAIGVGVLVDRCLPVRFGIAARVAGFITATLLVVALPLVLGFGRRPDTPSALPLDYGRALALTTAAIWTAAATAALARRGGRPTPPRRPPGARRRSPAR